MLNRRRTNGLALLLGAGLTLVLAGCGDSVLGTDSGNVRFVLSSGSSGLVANEVSAVIDQAPGVVQDGPALTDGEHHRYRQIFQSASVVLSSILARNVDGELVNVEMELPDTVDILALEDGQEVTLPPGTLPPATYDQVVIVMTHVEVVTLDGTEIAITPPGGGWTAVIPLCPFIVEGDGPTEVNIKFMLDQAFSMRNSRYHFQPQFVCDEER
jgi:hypothetical protein